MGQKLRLGSLARAALLAAGVSGLLLACTQQPLPGVDPTPPRTSPPSPSAGQPLPPVDITGESAVPTSTIERDASGWETEDGASGAQHQADLESCYAFANAQVRHDEQINDDRGTIFRSNNPAQAGNLYQFEQADRPYASEQRFGQLFRSCMASRGYQQN